MGIASTQLNKKEDKMKKTALIFVAFALLFSCASTIKSPKEGKTAPDFNVTDVSGDEVRMSDYKGKKNLVLVFYSDSTWPYSRTQLGGLQRKISEINELDTEVIAFATEGNQNDVEITKNDLNITFTLIPTPNRQVANDFGVNTYDTIIIDKNGIIRSQVGQVFPTASSTIKKLQAL